jgi:hypothetical protein
MSIARRDPELSRMLVATRNHTMMPQRNRVTIYEHGLRVLNSGEAGAFAEFGVNRGGGIGVLAHALAAAGRPLHLFDSWGEIPEATAEDGAVGEAWSEWVKAGGFEPLRGDDARGAAERLLVQDLGMPSESVTFHVGLFDQTLPAYGGGPIAFAHVDADWYESTVTVLEFLDQQLSDRAVLVADDYGSLPGVAEAFEHWRGSSERAIRIEPRQGQAVVEVGEAV